jgi:hypothetical protein
MKRNNMEPLTIQADNLSLGWANVISELLKPGIQQIAPLTLIIRGFDEHGAAGEIPAIRGAVDAFLAAQGKRDTENVAWTIFPQRYWEMAGKDRTLFFEIFIDAFQRVQAFNPRNNKRGSYFQRMIDLNGDGSGPNQLRWMLDQYRDHPAARRASKFQATTFDPARDHSPTAQLEFPCLQQVSFTFADDALHLNAFYATQQIARKAYGNYLGLSRLGAFMAHEMGLRFEQMNIFVGMAQMDVTKSDPDLVAMMEIVRDHMNEPLSNLAIA